MGQNACWEKYITPARLTELKATGLSNRAVARETGVTKPYIDQAVKALGLNTEKYSRIIGDNIKCSRCLLLKEKKAYSINRTNTEAAYRLGMCNACRYARQLELHYGSAESYLHTHWLQLRRRGRATCTITEKDLLKRYYDQEGCCFYTGVKLQWGPDTIMKTRISVDKIIPELGYTPGNIVFCSCKVNTTKSNLTLEDIKAWMPGWYEKIAEYLSSLGLGDRLFRCGETMREF